MTDRAFDPLLHLRARRGPLQAEHDAQMGIAPKELEKLLRGAAWIVDFEPRVIDMPIKISGESGDAGLGAALIKQTSELGEAAALGDDDAVQLDSLVSEHDRNHLASESYERFAWRKLEDLSEIAVDDPLAQVGDHAGEQRFLAPEVSIDGHLGDARAQRHHIHAGALEAVLEKDRLGAPQDCIPLRVAPPIQDRNRRRSGR